MGKLMYSFIIPVYKCEKYLEECISSIQNQKLDNNYEIILVDDGSPDRSPKICDYYDEKYENIRVFHKENGGASSARNYGIERAKGKYLLFIDGDDTLDAQLIETIEKQDVISELIIYGMSFDYYSHTKIERTEVLSYPEDGQIDIKKLGERFEQFFQCNSLSSACNKVFSREIVDKNHIRFDETMNLYEDFDFVLRYLQYINNIYCIKEGYYHYRLQQQNTHLKRRVSDLFMLMNNLKKVGYSVEKLGQKLGDFNIGSETYKRLYLQLIYLHLLYSENISNSICVLSQEIQKDKEIKRWLYNKDGLGENEKILLDYIMNNETKRLYEWIRKKRFNMNMKNVLRPFVKTIRKVIK